MTSFNEADEDERIRRLELVYTRYPALEPLDPTALVMNGLVPGHFDLTSDGELVALDDYACMLVQGSREILALMESEE